MIQVNAIDEWRIVVPLRFARAVSGQAVADAPDVDDRGYHMGTRPSAWGTTTIRGSMFGVMVGNTARVKLVREDIEEYRKRSPVNHAKELQTPLLIHTTTNDEDVNYLEVEHLIQALKAEGKKFEYKVYENAPGGHYFNRVDTRLARDSRKEIYQFLARYLKPANPM